MASTLAGNTTAFGELVLRYQDRLFHVILRVVDQPEDASDVLQETFISAYHALPNFKGDSELFTWLYRIAFNSAITQRRKKKPVVSLDSGRPSDPVIDPVDESLGNQPGDELTRREDHRQLHEAIAKLSPEHREVLLMKDLDDLKYEDIAEVLGVPIGTVRSRLHRARLELRALLEEQWNSDSIAGNG